MASPFQDSNEINYSDLNNHQPYLKIKSDPVHIATINQTEHEEENKNFSNFPPLAPGKKDEILNEEDYAPYEYYSSEYPEDEYHDFSVGGNSNNNYSQHDAEVEKFSKFLSIVLISFLFFVFIICCLVYRRRVR